MIFLVDPSVVPLFSFVDPAIVESSGLVDLGDAVATINDSGSGPVVFLVDKNSGRTIGRTTYTTDPVVDVEALAAGPDGSLWVADIGDNSAERRTVSIYRVPALTPGDQQVEAARYDFSYRGGSRDAETLLINPQTGRLYVVSKGLFGSGIYAAPSTLSQETVNVLTQVGDAGGLITDGAFFPDGRHIVLRNYSNGLVYEADDWASVAGVRLPRQEQGEGIAMTPSGKRVLVSSEGVNQTVYSVAIPRKVLKAITPLPDTVSPGSDTTGSDTTGTDATAPSHDDGGMLRLFSLTAVVLAFSLGIRAFFRVRASRRRSRHTP